ncbi:MAG: hypothetical protein ACKOH8_04035 [Gemmatimonadota bacterium]
MEGPSVTTAAGPTLPKELVDLLVEFSVGMVKAAIYPPGHPILDTVSTGVLGRLNAVLATRPALVIGVAPMQLIVDAIATDPNHPVLRALATRLHQHQIGSIRITPGVTVDELERLMQTLGTAGSGDRPSTRTRRPRRPRAVAASPVDGAELLVPRVGRRGDALDR